MEHYCGSIKEGIFFSWLFRTYLYHSSKTKSIFIYPNCGPLYITSFVYILQCFSHASCEWEPRFSRERSSAQQFCRISGWSVLSLSWRTVPIYRPKVTWRAWVKSELENPCIDTFLDPCVELGWQRNILPKRITITPIYQPISSPTKELVSRPILANLFLKPSKSH